MLMKGASLADIRAAALRSLIPPPRLNHRATIVSRLKNKLTATYG
jgi:hypothetical protein